MKLLPKEVKQRFEQGELKIALLGMSNIGKSHFAARLGREFGFQSVEVDAVIQSKLGKSSMDDHAEWLGQPYSDGYAARSAEAMRLETEATSEAMDLCANGDNFVLDAPGSVIYVDAPVLTRLSDEFWNIYVRAEDDDLERLKQLYITSPKPLIWNGNYNSSLANDPHEAAMESYAGLLKSRAEHYARLADITLDARPLFMGEIDLKTALGF